MVKPWVIKVIIGVIGFGGGFAAGFLTHKKMNNLEFEEVTSEEFAALEKKAMAEDNKLSQTDINKTPEMASEGLGAAQKLPDDADAIRNTLQGKKPFIEADNAQKQAYEKMWKATKEYSSEENANAIPVYPVSPNQATDEAEEEHPEDEDFDEEFLEQLEQEAVETGNSFTDPPHEIDLSEYYNGRPDYDKVTIKWFEPDNTWVDENDDVIADISSYVGSDVKPFARPGLDGEEDIRFYRNDRYGTDYEIIRHHRSWHEETGE